MISPLLFGLENYEALPHASSLCGACKQACPVDIDIPRMLLDLRRDLVAEGHSAASWNMGMKLPWETISARRRFSSAMGPRMTPITRGAMG